MPWFLHISTKLWRHLNSSTSFQYRRWDLMIVLLTSVITIYWDVVKLYWNVVNYREEVLCKKKQFWFLLNNGTRAGCEWIFFVFIFILVLCIMPCFPFCSWSHAPTRRPAPSDIHSRSVICSWHWWTTLVRLMKPTVVGFSRYECRRSSRIEIARFV